MILAGLFAHPVLGAVADWLLTYLVHSTVLLGGVWLITRRVPEYHRLNELLWKSALFGALITASVQAGPRLGSTRSDIAGATPFVTVPANAAVDAPLGPIAALPAIERSGAASVDRPAAQPGAVSSASAAARPPVPLPAVLVVLWSAVAIVLVLQLLITRWRFGRRIGRRAPVPDEALAASAARLSGSLSFGRTVRVTSAPRLDGPVALGLREICLPTAVLTEFDAAERAAILAHELAHLQRRDPLWFTAAALCDRIFFFQPLNRIAGIRIREAAEYLCDERAAQSVGSGVRVARALARVAEWLQAGPSEMVVAGMAETPSQLVGRVRRLVEERQTASAPRAAWGVIGGLALVGLTTAAAPVFGPAAAHPPVHRTQLAFAVDTPPARRSAARRDTNFVFLKPDSVAHVDGRADEARVGTFRVTLDSAEARSRDSVFVTAADRIDAAERAQLARLTAERARMNQLMQQHRRADTPAARAEIARLRVELARTDSMLHAGAGALPEAEARLQTVERSAAALAVATRRRHDPEVVAALAGALRDPNAKVRISAIMSLHEFALDTTPPALARAVADSDASVRLNAITAVGAIGDSVARATLLEALHGPDPDTRAAAARALGQLRER